MPNVSTGNRRKQYTAKGSREVMDVIKNAMKIENVSLKRMMTVWNVCKQTMANREEKPEFLRLYEIFDAMEVTKTDEITLRLR